jgi:hypothetical protein
MADGPVPSSFPAASSKKQKAGTTGSSSSNNRSIVLTDSIDMICGDLEKEELVGLSLKVAYF